MAGKRYGATVHGGYDLIGSEEDILKHSSGEYGYRLRHY